jgi:hypothetical protein
MPCYRCGTRQGDPEPGKSSPWRRGVVSEHQVLICPACQPAALSDLSRCPGCGSTHLIKRLDQLECLDCHLTRDAGDDPAGHGADRPATPGISEMSGISGAAAPDIPDEPKTGASPAARDPGLAAEVARALGRVLGRP